MDLDLSLLTKGFLLREIVEIAGETTPERILRKSNAAAKRLLTGLDIKFSIDADHLVRFEENDSLHHEQLEILKLLAQTANFAISNIHSSDLAHRLEINEERLRIARDLHDRVLQRLFATGISLEGALRKAVVDDVIKALRQAIVDLDETVGQIRTTVHSLKGPVGSIRHQILREIESARQSWAMVIDFNLKGPIDSVIPIEMYDDIVSVTAELLANSGKHGTSQQAKYNLETTGNTLEISVTNLMENFSSLRFGSGLENLSDRANKYGGQLLVENLHPSLKVTWKVSL